MMKSSPSSHHHPAHPPAILPPSSTDYGIRYAANWSVISRQAKQSTKGVCCYPNCYGNAVETHHVLYRDKQGTIAGREIPGVHIFPLCEIHHSREHREGAHHPKNWRKDRKNPALGNQNTPEYYLRLRQGWRDKVDAVEYRNRKITDNS